MAVIGVAVFHWIGLGVESSQLDVWHAAQTQLDSLIENKECTGNDGDGGRSVKRANASTK